MAEFLGPIQFRRDTTANWTATNPVLADGEMGVDTTVKRAKIGDGATGWVALPWINIDQATITSVLAAADIVSGAVEDATTAADAAGIAKYDAIAARTGAQDAQAAAELAAASVAPGAPNGTATLDGSSKVPAVQIPMSDIAASPELSAAFGRPVSTDGTAGLPAPTGVGLEMVITSTGLQDIRMNGVSL